MWIWLLSICLNNLLLLVIYIYFCNHKRLWYKLKNHKGYLAKYHENKKHFNTNFCMTVFIYPLKSGKKAGLWKLIRKRKCWKSCDLNLFLEQKLVKCEINFLIGWQFRKWNGTLCFHFWGVQRRGLRSVVQKIGRHVFAKRFSSKLSLLKHSDPKQSKLFKNSKFKIKKIPIFEVFE